VDDITRPNGVQLSRDDKTLYVNDTGGIHAYAFDVLPDGRLANRRVFATYVGRDRTIPADAAPISNADGLVIDEDGRVYALTEAGIEVVSPGGQHLGVIPVWCITRRCQDLAFGGAEKRTLYVAGGGTLLRIQMRSRGITRRRVLESGAGLLAAAALPAPAAAAGQGAREAGAAPSDLTGRVARYMAAARQQPLPPEVLRETRHRVLDTVAAIVSGSRLKPGEMAIRFVQSQGGTPEASVLTTRIRTSAINAALINAMFAHADETDDFEPVTKAHPGCAAVPAALAVGERDNRSGQDLLRAVALGYDLGCRWLMALGPNHVRATHRSAEGVSATMGAAAAAASMAQLDERAMRYALSYAAQQVSGIWSWERDVEHVEKAFDFAGMGARNGVTAALMAQAGFSGVPDVLEGEHNALEAHSAQPHPEEMAADLGRRFYVTETAIKTFSVGYPIQSALDALLTLRREHALTPANVDRVIARLPEDGAGIVNDSAMPDVNLQYL